MEQGMVPGCRGKARNRGKGFARQLSATTALGRPARGGLRVPVSLLLGLATASRSCPQAARLPAGRFLTLRDPGPPGPYLMESEERTAERPGHAAGPGQHCDGGGSGSAAEGGRTPDVGPGNNRKRGGIPHPPHQ